MTINQNFILLRSIEKMNTAFPCESVLLPASLPLNPALNVVLAITVAATVLMVVSFRTKTYVVDNVAFPIVEKS